MDADRFDAFARAYGASAARRRLLWLGTALPIAGILVRTLGDEAMADGSGAGVGGGGHRRRKRRARRQHHPGDDKENRTGKRKGKAARRPCVPPDTSLQGLINAAEPGVTIRLCAGIFLGAAIEKNLTLVGAGQGRTVVHDGLWVNTPLQTQVLVRDLTIARQSAAFPDGWSYMIQNKGTLRLERVSVLGDGNPKNGRGIINHGSLTLGKGVSISGHSGIEGGGILNWGQGPSTVEGVVTLEAGSSVTDNEATGGGGILNLGGTVTLRSGSVVARNTAAEGGGILNGGNFVGRLIFGSVTLESGSRVTDNAAVGPTPGSGQRATGGGIMVHGGTVTVRAGCTVAGNAAGTAGGPFNGGGGIFANGGTVVIEAAASVNGNTPDNCAPPNAVPNCIG
jgi:hypothetical protein